MKALIIAGGAGTRLWPLSTKRRPKQFHSLTGKRSLIRATVERLLALTSFADIRIVTGCDYEAQIAAELPELTPDQIVTEPFPIGTNLAVGLGLIGLARENPDETVLVCWADAHLGNNRVFADTVNAAAASLGDFDGVLIGAEPTYPATGYGYMASAAGPGEVAPLLSFHEKPDLATAARYLEEGAFAWNTGISVWRAGRLMDLIARYAPDHFAAIEAIEDAGGPRAAPELACTLLTGLAAEPIDKVVFERAERVGTVTASFGWSDIGSWSSLYDISADNGSELSLRGNVVAVKANNCLINSTEKLLAVYGVDDLVVVETEDVVLVTRKSLSENLKEIYEEVVARTGEQFR